MRMHFRVSIYFAVLAIGMTLASVSPAQPRSPPPQHYSADDAAKMLGAPTLITLKKENAKPVDVLQAIAEQAGMTVNSDLVVAVENHAAVSVNYDKQPFWSVLRSLASQLKVLLGIGESFPPSESGFAIVATEHSLDGPAHVSGPVMVVMNQIARSTTLSSAGKAAGNQQITVELLVLADPKLKLRDGHLRGAKIEFRSDKGEALKPLGPEFSWIEQPRKLSPLVWSVKASAELPNANVRSLKQLRGELSGFVATLATEKWTIDDVVNAKYQHKEVGNADFAFRGLNKNDFQKYTLFIASAGQGEETDFGWPPRTNEDRIACLKLVDTAGKGLPPQSWKFEDGRGEVSYRLLQTDGEPAKLIWELPAKIGQFAVPFEFANIPLP